jgi:two-component system chemotaxis response regulator CheY
MMGPLVLVVDDDRDIRDSLMEILEDHGYAAVGASNGVEAIDVLRAHPVPPCLILLDLMMPVMDGRGFREEQLKHPAWAAIPVIVVSAYGDVEAQASELALDYMRKPLATRPLIAAIERRCGPAATT